MFIKINKRFSKKLKCAIFQFSVVESYRDGGKVKHRTLCFLSGLPEKHFNTLMWVKCFWTACERKLESFSASDRLRLLEKIENTVPRPNAAMELEFERSWQRVEEMLAGKNLRG